MNATFEVILALNVIYAIAIVSVLILLTIPQRNVLAGWSIAAPVLACPLLISPEHVLLRAVVSIPRVDVWFKLIDLSRELRCVNSPKSIRECLLFLIPFPVLQVVLAERRRLATRHVRFIDIARVVCGGAVYSTAYCMLRTMADIEILRSNFPLDHFVKLGLFLVVTIAWFAVSSILFCHGVDRVIPIYYASKSWLP